MISGWRREREAAARRALDLSIPTRPTSQPPLRPPKLSPLMFIPDAVMLRMTTQRDVTAVSVPAQVREPVIRGGIVPPPTTALPLAARDPSRSPLMFTPRAVYLRMPRPAQAPPLVPIQAQPTGDATASLMPPPQAPCPALPPPSRLTRIAGGGTGQVAPRTQRPVNYQHKKVTS